MIIGAHAIIYSKNAEADRAFFRDVLKFPSVNVGEGWLIFGMPPAEAAFHPSEENGDHEFYLMCDDVKAFVSGMRARKVACGDPQDMGWGIMTQMTLPGGGQLGVYQPRHARPKSAPAASPAKKAPAGARKGPAKKSPAKSRAKKSASKKAPAKARAKSSGARKPAAKKAAAKKGSKKAKRR